jgi:hypothetical protein
MNRGRFHRMPLVRRHYNHLIFIQVIALTGNLYVQFSFDNDDYGTVGRCVFVRTKRYGDELEVRDQTLAW